MLASDDLTATLAAIAAGTRRAADVVATCVAMARSPACRHAFIGDHHDPVPVRSARVDGTTPLGGLPVSIKDLYDVQGEPTRAGSTALDDAPAAHHDSPAVARLRAAGAGFVGRTNMSEFAFSGVGVNPHFGTPANPAPGAQDVPRVPGGSSSGAAVSVAAGAAFIGLGSDTGGSIRIPAALCGVVGFKNTARLTPTEGALPLSPTLDTVCAITRSVRDAILAHEILAARRVDRAPRPLAGARLAVVRTALLDSLDASVAADFERALDLLSRAGATIETIDLAPIERLSTLQSTGGFSAAESYAWHRRLLAERGDRYDPRVRMRIERGAAMKAWEYLDLVRDRAAWIDAMSRTLDAFDAVVSPTVPIVAAPIASVAPAGGVDARADAARDAEFFRVNALLLRNTSVVNMLDGCAISLPMHRGDALPTGLMLWHRALRDDALLNLALEVEAALAPCRDVG